MTDQSQQPPQDRTERPTHWLKDFGTNFLTGVAILAVVGALMTFRMLNKMTFEQLHGPPKK